MDLINKGILNIIKYKQLINLERILYFLFLPVDRDLTSSEEGEKEKEETSQPAKKQNNSRKKKVS